MRNVFSFLVFFAICGPAPSLLAQDLEKDGAKETYIDKDGNRIPWYKPMPDDGQTRTTVDMRFAPAEMKMVGPSPEAARATKYADFPVSYGLGLVDVNIPLYLVKSHSLTLPRSLS